MLLLNDMKRKLLACFYPLQVLCNTSFFQFDQLIFFILVFILLIEYINVIYLGYFAKIKVIMIVNRRIIFSFEIFVMIKSLIMVNYAPFYLITDPDLCERIYLHDFTYLTGFWVVRNNLCY